MITYYSFNEWRVVHSYFTKFMNLGYVVVVCVGDDDAFGEEYITFSSSTWNALCNGDIKFDPENKVFTDKLGKVINHSIAGGCILYVDHIQEGIC